MSAETICGSRFEDVSRVTVGNGQKVRVRVHATLRHACAAGRVQKYCQIVLRCGATFVVSLAPAERFHVDARHRVRIEFLDLFPQVRFCNKQGRSGAFENDTYLTCPNQRRRRYSHSPDAEYRKQRGNEVRTI